MSTFYGNLQGNRGEATRCGSKASGIWAAARSWDGSVSVHLYENDGVTHAHIAVGRGSTASPGRTIYNGPISELIEREAA